MPSNVYFHSIDANTDTPEIQRVSRLLLQKLIETEKISLARHIPLKLHFGEKGNKTFLSPECYHGIVDYLDDNGIESCYIETSAMYGGHRYKSELHRETAFEHGFTRLPVVFADGDHGEDFLEVPIKGKHFSSFKIGRAFKDFDQMLVLSHFKGHLLAGFGGAIKQLSMGCASKGGKMAIHIGEKPRLKSRKCKRCNLCKTRCAENALIIGEKSYIDHQKCVGCGACMAICPHNAITIFSLRTIPKFFGFWNPFIEKLVEGARAASLNKNHIYMNFAMNITKGCDCEPRHMKPVMEDFGIFASLDPVAIDRACLDMAAARGWKFKEYNTLAYAESLGLGTQNHNIIKPDSL